MGVKFSWAREGGIQADKVALGHVASLNCGASGGKIQEVSFASFGTPSSPLTMSSELGVIDAGCHAGKSKQVIEKLCLGKSSCQIPASQTLFFPEGETFESGNCSNRDPTQPLRLWVEAQCELPVSLNVSAKIPVQSTARLLFPLSRLLESQHAGLDKTRTLHLHAAGLSEPLLKFSSDLSLWEESFPRSTNHGVRSVSLEHGEQGAVLSVAVGSGSYNLALTSAQ